MMHVTPEAQTLLRNAALLGATLRGQVAQGLLALVPELQRWNRTHNLTAIDEHDAIVTQHLLDSLSAAPFIKGERIADVGTGAGFPGLPLAAAFPDKHFTLIDSNGKKIHFVRHAQRMLHLANVDAVHARAEEFKPAAAFDCVVARAYAALPEFLHSVETLCKPSTLVVAMKGRAPLAELAALPANWRLLDMQRVEVPGLAAERHIVRLVQASHPPQAGPDAAASPADAAH